MTIDEAIAHARKVAKENRKQHKTGCLGHIEEYYDAKQRAEEHEQLAEWLEDYKRVKKWKDEIMEEFCRYDASSIEELMQRARNKAIDDLVIQCKKVHARGLITNWGKPFGIEFDKLDEIAQQLKEGDPDGNSTTDN